MLRYLRIGNARAQLLEVVQHDPGAVAGVLAALDSLRPEAVIIDRSPEDWQAILSGRNKLNTLEAAFYDAAAAACPAQPFAVARAVAAWCEAARVPVRLALPPGLEMMGGRKEERRLTKRLRRQPQQSAATPEDAVLGLYKYHLRELEGVMATIRQRRMDVAAALMTVPRVMQAKRLAAVVSFPDGDAIEHLVHDALKRGL